MSRKFRVNASRNPVKCADAGSDVYFVVLDSAGNIVSTSVVDADIADRTARQLRSGGRKVRKFTNEADYNAFLDKCDESRRENSRMSKKSVGASTKRKSTVQSAWMSHGKKAKIRSTYKTDDNYMMFEVGDDFIGISVNNSWPNGEAWISTHVVTCDDAEALFNYVKDAMEEHPEWSVITALKKSGYKYKITSFPGMRSPEVTRRVGASTSTKRRKVCATKLGDLYDFKYDYDENAVVRAVYDDLYSRFGSGQFDAARFSMTSITTEKATGDTFFNINLDSTVHRGSFVVIQVVCDSDADSFDVYLYYDSQTQADEELIDTFKMDESASEKIKNLVLAYAREYSNRWDTVTSSSSTKRKFTIKADALSDFRKDWTERIFDKNYPSEKIEVHFKDGRAAQYTASVLDRMMSDPDIDYIIDAMTGELLYESEHGDVRSGVKCSARPAKRKTTIKASDDYGVSPVTLEYAASDFASDEVKSAKSVKCSALDDARDNREELSGTYYIVYNGNIIVETDGTGDAGEDALAEVFTMDADALAAAVEYLNSFGDDLIEEDEVSDAGEVARVLSQFIQMEYDEGQMDPTYFGSEIYWSGGGRIEWFDAADLAESNNVDEWIENTDLSAEDLDIDSAQSIECGDAIADRFMVDLMYQKNGGYAEDRYFDDWSDVEAYAHDGLMRGLYARIWDKQTGDTITISPDEYAEAWENGAADFDINEGIVNFKKHAVTSSTKIEAFRDDTVDETAVRELVLVITNDGDLYRQRTTPIIENLKKKAAKGTYDREKAVKLWQYLADDGVRMYDKEYGSGRGSVAMLNPATRRRIAEELRDYYEEEIMWDINHDDADSELTTM